MASALLFVSVLMQADNIPSFALMYSNDIYLYFLCLGVPIFYVFGKLFGWTFWCCLLSATIVVVLCAFMNRGTNAELPIPAYIFWLSEIISIVAYGGTFWLLAPAYFDKEIETLRA